MTLNLFYRLYKQYKNTFDIEMLMVASQTTYEKLRAKSQKSDLWLS